MTDRTIRKHERKSSGRSESVLCRKELTPFEFLSSNNIDISMIKGILITHAHLDHYGSLNFFEQSNLPIFMTEITKDLRRDLKPV